MIGDDSDDGSDSDNDDSDNDDDHHHLSYLIESTFKIIANIR